MWTKDQNELINECRTEADKMVSAARLTEFGVPVNLVAEFVELVASALAAEFHRGAIHAIDDIRGVK